MKCPECKTRFDGEYCPSCGCRNPKFEQQRKKILAEEEAHTKIVGIQNETPTEKTERLKYNHLDEAAEPFQKKYNKTLPINPIKLVIVFVAVALLLGVGFPLIQGLIQSQSESAQETNYTTFSLSNGSYHGGDELPAGNIRLNVLPQQESNYGISQKRTAAKSCLPRAKAMPQPLSVLPSRKGTSCCLKMPKAVLFLQSFQTADFSCITNAT